ncbi:hypothetical protein JR316_0003737 [Psilocybe cubensis]|uniref:DUF4211 domain-containing protein n=2 Tax=Psilocybe cubensis TaxID=181762 RepID=A0A8H7Y5S7_PSICU|nr:hypothetical protein JR316_0003737 [Psilocybe cubensis]KAH9484257.1 hypothetical protein JR316_0003737 [Psilocybe cubensis]
MPRNSKAKDAKAMKQTKLFEKQELSSTVQYPSPSPSKGVTRTGAPAKRKRKATTQDSSSSDEISRIKMAPPTQPAVVEISSDDDESTSNPLPPKSSHNKRHIQLSSSSENPSESEDDVQPIRKRLRRKASLDTNSESPVDARPSKKSGRLRRLGSSERASSSSDDLKELAEEVEEERILNTRLRIRDKTVFQKNLDKLKRRKLKLEASEEDEEVEEEVDASQPLKGAKPSAEYDEYSDGDNSQSSFIVEDEGTVELPAEFSMETHQDLSHQFKKIFQFFVVRRKLSGLRDSLVASSVWRPEFIEHLKKYPTFELVSLDFAIPACDACHLGGRMSTLLGRLTGSPYNRSGFVEQKPRRSEAAKCKEYHLGRFCAKRTRVYHEFSHWEHSLFHRILQEIDALHNATSSRSFHTIGFSGARAPPDDISDADGVCDWLDDRKIIDTEWQKIKNMMESARQLELDKGRDVDD